MDLGLDMTETDWFALLLTPIPATGQPAQPPLLAPPEQLAVPTPPAAQFPASSAPAPTSSVASRTRPIRYLPPYPFVPGISGLAAHPNAPEWVHDTSLKVVIQDEKTHRLQVLCTVIVCPLCGHSAPSDEMAAHFRKAHTLSSGQGAFCLWPGCESASKAMAVMSLKRHIEYTHLLIIREHCPYCHGSWRKNDKKQPHASTDFKCDAHKRVLCGQWRGSESRMVENCDGWCQTWQAGLGCWLPEVDTSSRYARIVGPGWEVSHVAHP